MQRQTLLDKDLLYLFSYDANLEMRRDEIGFVPGGVRVNIFAKPRDTRVYHVARERTTTGSRTIQGSVEWGTDWALIRTDDIGSLDVRLTIKTDDGATIFSWYKGVFPSGDRGFRKLISEDPLVGSEQHPVEAPVYVTPHYETADPRYAWIGQHQCVGFGRIKIVKSLVRSVSFDIYAMDA
ncbi:MAG TPA: DUF3237 family protein [Polyangiaceae bacterium]|nr:DUF3237 family protein [Polyangiaceae bacterium]